MLCKIIAHIGLSACVGLVAALPLVQPATQPAAQPAVHLIYEYPINDTWIENLAVRTNGFILFTSIGKPGGLHMIDPMATKPKPEFVTSFGNLNSTLGIVETTPDTFYVIASNSSISTLESHPGSNYVYRVTFSGYSSASRVEVVSHLERAQTINGLTALNDTLLLAADSAAGVVYSIDTETGAYRQVISDPLMASEPYEPVGVDGLKIRNGTLYFTNAVQSTFAKIPINADGTASGPAVKVASSTPNGQYDDFSFDTLGDAYAATGVGNSIQKIAANGDTSVVAGRYHSIEIAEPSATAFGRTTRDSKVLYVTTGGGSGQPVTVHGRRVSVGAQILAVDLS